MQPGRMPIAVLEQGNVRLMGDAAHQEAVGGLLLRNDRQGGLVELGHQLGGFLGLGRLGVHGRGLRDGQALAMRVGIGQRPFQAFASEDHHEPMAFAGLDDDLGVADLLHLLRTARRRVPRRPWCQCGRRAGR